MKNRIITPSRIHSGLINLSGLYGRIDSGIGFSISKPCWDIEIEKSKKFELTGLSIEKELVSITEEIITNIKREYQVESNFKIVINAKVPLHAGLGSKTSYILSLGKLIHSFYQIPFETTKFAYKYKRGSTSGIGVNSFDSGGFVCDIGHKFPEDKKDFLPSSESKSPPAQGLLSVPVKDWKIMHFRFSDLGVFGKKEKDLFQKNCPVGHNETKDILSNCFFYIFSGIISKDLKSLQTGLKNIQNIGFKKIEWGIQTEMVKEFRRIWEIDNPNQTLCLSSVGPTMYVIGNNFEKAEKILESFGVQTFHKTVCQFSNKGYNIL